MGGGRFRSRRASRESRPDPADPLRRLRRHRRRLRIADRLLYVSANHWPRAWYEQALANPKVEVTVDGQRGAYTAVPVTGAEHDQLMAEHGHPLVFLILTGFPPRHFLRLDPG
jgi:hypothetical protein